SDLALSADERFADVLENSQPAVAAAVADRRRRTLPPAPADAPAGKGPTRLARRVEPAPTGRRGPASEPVLHRPQHGRNSLGQLGRASALRQPRGGEDAGLRAWRAGRSAPETAGTRPRHGSLAEFVEAREGARWRQFQHGNRLPARRW